MKNMGEWQDPSTSLIHILPQTLISTRVLSTNGDKVKVEGLLHEQRWW